MQVFITGGSGYLGTALVQEFVAAGHDVVALARSADSAAALEANGAHPVAGSLADTDVLEASASRADAVVHAAVDYSGSDEAKALELAAVAALLRGAGEGDDGKPFVYTSTGLVYGFAPGQSRDESAELPAVSAQPVKAAGEKLVMAADGVTGIVLRAGLIYGRGGSGLVTMLIRSATATGAATYVGSGENVWTPVHVDDLARLYTTVLERPVAGIYNAVGDTPFTFRALAEAVAALTGAEATSISIADAEAALGPAAHLVASSATTSAAKARATFAWTPTGRSLVDEVRAGSYTAAAAPVGE